MAITFDSIMSSAGAVGRRFFSFEDYDNALDKAIERAMQNSDSRVQINAKKTITETAEKRVYNTYTPRFMSRRHGDGGILDPASYRSERYSDNAIITKNAGKGFTLHIYADAEWQQLFGGNPSDNIDSLTTAIEENGIYHAPRRPFMSAAEEEYGSKRFGKDLVDELESDGF